MFLRCTLLACCAGLFAACQADGETPGGPKGSGPDPAAAAGMDWAPATWPLLDASTAAEAEAAIDGATSCPNPLNHGLALPFDFTETVAYYDFEGTTAQEMRAQIAPQQPQPGIDAEAIWEIGWSFESPDNCYTASWSLQLDVTYRFPRWTPSEDADPRLASAWDAYVDALWCHEYGHTDIGVAATLAAQQALEAIGPQFSCAALQIVADRTFNRVVRQYLDEEALYDRNTNHGETTGARFPQALY